MKKDLFAAGLLAVLLTLSLINSAVIKSLCDDIDATVRRSGDAAQTGDWETAQSEVNSALELWRKREGYTKIVLRHTDIETLTDDFYELTEHIYSKDPGSVKSAVELVGEHLSDISQMEAINFGSIF